MANQHTNELTRKITLPAIPGLQPLTTPQPRKTPLEADQERRIRFAAPQPVMADPVTRPTISESYLLDLLRTGPKTAAALGASLGIATGRISTTLTNLRKKGRVVMISQRPKSASALWALPKGAGK